MRLLRVHAVAVAALAVVSLGVSAAACTSSNDSGAPPASDAGGATHAGAAPPITDGAASPACVTNPQTYLDIINACTDAQAVDKTDDLSVMNLPDGGLRPLP